MQGRTHVCACLEYTRADTQVGPCSFSFTPLERGAPSLRGAGCVISSFGLHTPKSPLERGLMIFSVLAGKESPAEDPAFRGDSCHINAVFIVGGRRPRLPPLCHSCAGGNPENGFVFSLFNVFLYNSIPANGIHDHCILKSINDLRERRLPRRNTQAYSDLLRHAKPS